MEIEILEKEKNRLKMKITGENHTVLNLLRKELFNDDSVEFAGYMIEHPLKDIAIFNVTTNKKTPQKAVSDALKRMQKSVANIKSEFKKI